MNAYDLLATTLVGVASGVASIPHCAAMCGPFSAAVCARSGQPRASSRYWFGRCVGYSVAGVLAVRFSLALSDLLPAVVMPVLIPLLTAGACLLWALRLWGPGSARRVRLRLRKQEQQGKKSTYARSRPLAQGRLYVWVLRLLQLMPRDALVVGVASALLPCGALAAALLLAAGTGHPLQGGLLMLGFAAASGMALVVASALQRWAAQRLWGRARQTLALVLLMFAGVSVAAALDSGMEAIHGSTAVRATPCH